jgi:hypothetical protein
MLKLVSRFKKRKKGSAILLGLMTLIMIFVLAAVFINIAISYETLNRVQEAVEEGARVRAQAIDVPLKEYAAIVEAFHNPNNYETNGTSDYDMHYQIQKKFYEENVSGHAEPFNPYGAVVPAAWSSSNAYEMPELYMDSVNASDEAAKKIVQTVLNNSLGTNSYGEKMVNIGPENICIDVKPLPSKTSTPTIPGKPNNVIRFSCETELYGKITEDRVVSYQEDNVVKVYDENNQQYGEVQVKNVVYVAVVFEYKHMLYKYLENLGWHNPPVKKLSAVAYPQVDQCFGTLCN